MTFDKALEAMRQGKEVMREFWEHKSNAVIGIDTGNIGEMRLYIRHLCDSCEEKRYCNIGSSDLMANDWEIYEPKTWYNIANPGYNCRCEIKPEEIERLKKTLSENMHICFEPHKEEPTMYTDLEITFKSGETITYSKGEWDDYSYDGKAVAVKKDGAWVGLYNFDNVFCVELKSRED